MRPCCEAPETAETTVIAKRVEKTAMDDIDTHCTQEGTPSPMYCGSANMQTTMAMTIAWKTAANWKPSFAARPEFLWRDLLSS